MNADPELCVVVFKYKRLLGADTSAQGVATRSNNGIQEAWHLAVAEHQIKASKVVEIFAEWSATSQDVEFLKSQFPNIPFSYSFERPENDDGWQAAFAEANQQMQDAAGESDGEADGALDFSPMLLPALRNNDPENILTQTMLHMPLGKSGLVAALANIAPTPHGTIGADWVMKASVQDDSVDEMFGQALNNVRESLSIEGGEAESGETFLVVTHPAFHGASAMCLPGFFDQATEWVKSPDLFVGVPNPEVLLIAPWDSPTSKKFHAQVMDAECLDGQPLSPTCFRYTEGEMKRVATHPNGIWPGLGAS